MLSSVPEVDVSEESSDLFDFHDDLGGSLVSSQVLNVHLVVGLGLDVDEVG